MAYRWILLAWLFLASVVVAAPAPLQKKSRQRPPTPGQLLDYFRGQGYTVTDLQRGPEPGTWIVTVPTVINRGKEDRVLDVACTVHSGDRDSITTIRAFLDRLRNQPF